MSNRKSLHRKNSKPQEDEEQESPALLHRGIRLHRLTCNKQTILVGWLILTLVITLLYAASAGFNSRIRNDSSLKPWTNWTQDQTRHLAVVIWTPPSLVFYIPAQTFHHRIAIRDYVMERMKALRRFWLEWIEAVMHALVDVLVPQVLNACSMIFYALLVPLGQIGTNIVFWILYLGTTIGNWIFSVSATIVALAWSLVHELMVWIGSSLLVPVSLALAAVEEWIRF